MITAAYFRSALPEFADVAKYPNASVDFWIGVAAVLLPQTTWGAPATPAPAAPAAPTTLYDIGTILYVAHQVLTEAQSLAASTAGVSPGASKGPVTAESVGGVSRSYDAGATLLESGGDWNRTTYGVRFLQMARTVARGPLEIGATLGCFGPGPWFGPPVGPNGFY